MSMNGCSKRRTSGRIGKLIEHHTLVGNQRSEEEALCKKKATINYQDLKFRLDFLLVQIVLGRRFQKFIYRVTNRAKSAISNFYRKRMSIWKLEQKFSASLIIGN